MTTSLQAAASRTNGSHSKGPTSQAGKAIAARNSIRHGLCSSHFHLDEPIEQAALERLRLDLVKTWSAVDEAQLREIEQIAIATWRQGVVANVEAALWKAVAEGEASAETGGDGLPSINSINRYRARIERDLKLAKANLMELQERRVAAIRLELAKAREFKELNILADLENDLGPQGLSMFKEACTNEPEQAASSPNQKARSQQQSTSRRRATKLARKQKHRK